MAAPPRNAWGLALLAALAVPLCAGCFAPRAPAAVAPDTQEEAVRFVVLGDSGTGSVEQYRVAYAIGQACQTRGCDFLVHTGDILYDVGASSPTDPQFMDKFERPYGALGLPVYLVLGNHDVGGDPSGPEGLGRWRSVGDEEIAYGHRLDRPTDTWRMPGRWYSFHKGNVSFAAFDTSAFVFGSMETDGGPLHDAMARQERFADSAWPANGTWRFAIGHHPYRSNGQHGDAGAYGRDEDDEDMPGGLLEDFYESKVCGKVDVLLTGHDHDLEWLAPVSSCGSTRFLVSGAAARPRPLGDPLRHDALFQKGGTLGFWWLEAKGPHLRLVAYDLHAQPLFEGTFDKPSPTAPAGASSTGTPL